MCIWWSRMFLDSRCTYSCIYCWLHHDSMWLCTPSTIFWRGYFTCYCYGELHVISGITSDPETTLLLLLENILYGLLFAHPPPPPPPTSSFYQKQSPLSFWNPPTHTLWTLWWICQRLLLACHLCQLLCFYIAFVWAFVRMDMFNYKIWPWTGSLTRRARGKYM